VDQGVGKVRLAGFVIGKRAIEVWLVLKTELIGPQ
jgi:hypothetical protein